MAACRGTPDTDPFRVNPIFSGVRAEPAYGGFTILDLRGVDRFLAQTVIEACRDIASRDQWLRRTAMFVTALPAATMNPNDKGSQGTALGEVEVEALIRSAMGNIRDVTDCSNPFVGNLGVKSANTAASQQQRCDKTQEGSSDVFYGDSIFLVCAEITLKYSRPLG